MSQLPNNPLGSSGSQLTSSTLNSYAWQTAVDNRDDIELIVIYAWNEHKEHASIEPDKGTSPMSYGRSLIEKTAHYYGLFRAGLPLEPFDDTN